MNDFLAFINLPQAFAWFSVLRNVFLFFSLILVVSIIFFLFKASWLRHKILYDASEFLTYRPFGVKKIVRVWNKIKNRLDAGLESEYKLAVIEADNMMDKTLKRMGYGGETLGERLNKITSATLPNLDELREAHQSRNNIVHDPDFKLTLDEAKRIMEFYEKAFRDLEAF